MTEVEVRVRENNYFVKYYMMKDLCIVYAGH